VIVGAAAVLLGPAAGVARAGTAPVLTWSPTTSVHAYSYRALNPGETASQVFTLTNSGSPASTAVKLTLTGPAAFTLTADYCSGKRLGAGASCTVTVRYTPASYGEIDTALLTAARNKAVTRLTLHGRATKDATGITASPSAGGPVGATPVTDTATLSRGSSPTGTITFSLYGPSATANCTGTPVFGRAVAVSGNGSYTSPSFTPSQAGTYWWAASYSGDTANRPAATECGTGSVAISEASPALAASPGGSATVGTAVSDSAALAGGDNPTGTIEFQLWGPGATADCTGTPVFDQTVAVSGNGSYTSPPFTPSQAGTYWWAASYSGDTNNSPAASGCGDESVAISKDSPAIATSPGAGGTPGSTVTDTATLSGGFSPDGTITFSLYGPSQSANCSTTAVDIESVPVSGDGSYTTPAGATPLQTGTYWWTASYSGDTANNPAASNCGDASVTITPALYWTTQLGRGFTGDIVEANLDGSGSHAIATDPNLPLGVAATSSNLYWSDGRFGAIWEAGLDGSNPQVIITGQLDPSALAVDSGHLYWIDGDGAVWSAGLDGSNPTQIVPGVGGGDGLAVANGQLYWDEGGSITPVFEANLDGSNAHVIEAYEADPEGIAANSSNLYWGTDGAVREASLDGTNPQTIVTGQFDTMGVAINSSNLYWVGQHGIWEANLDGTNPQLINDDTSTGSPNNGLAIGS
jgi:hypothetical protein